MITTVTVPFLLYSRLDHCHELSSSVEFGRLVRWCPPLALSQQSRLDTVQPTHSRFVIGEAFIIIVTPA